MYILCQGAVPDQSVFSRARGSRIDPPSVLKKKNGRNAHALWLCFFVSVFL